MRATALCDLTGTDTAVRALNDGFEDDDRPATAVEDLSGELEETVFAVGGDRPSPAALMSAAVAVWLATNFGQGSDRGRVLREAARLRFGSKPPPEVEAWLADERVAA